MVKKITCTKIHHYYHTGELHYKLVVRNKGKFSMYYQLSSSISPYRTVDGSMTFALLLYVNIFYFAVFAGFELFLLIFKAYNMTDHPKHAYNATHLVNELAILAFMVVVESARLVLGNKHDLVS